MKTRFRSGRSSEPLEAHYDDKFTELALGALSRFVDQVDTDISRKASRLIAAGELKELLSLSVKPDDYDDSGTFADDYFIVSWLKKLQVTIPGVDRRAAALDTFNAAEALCAETNERLYRFVHEDPHLADDDVRAVFFAAQRLIERILGITPNLGRIEEGFRFGPGATSSHRASNARPSKKYGSNVLHVTPALAPFVRGISQDFWGEYVTKVELRSYDEIAFVPKKWSTDRTIGIGPHMNIFVQLGIGAEIGRLLALHGLVKQKQQDRNRVLAQKAYTHDLATIDLSSASDTVSLMLVRSLLPPDWVTLLETSRTSHYKIGNEVKAYHKHSAMGNGYTFELETLVFWALARAASAHVGAPVKLDGEWCCTAYGDDIVVSRAAVPLLLRTLKFCGFKVNEEKSFWQGDFFESCGADFFRGVNVRPVYTTGVYFDTVDAVFQMHNSLMRYASRRCMGMARDKRFLPSINYLKKKLPQVALKCRIPDGYGDGGLLSDWDEVCPSRTTDQQLSWRAYVRQYQPTKVPRDELGGLTASLHGRGRSDLPLGSISALEPLRGAVIAEFREASVHADWGNLGYWV